MHAQRFTMAVAFCAMVWAASLPAAAEKPPDLGTVKFKSLAKYLELTPDQQGKIKKNVERVQEIVKDANKMQGGAWGVSGRRAPVGGMGTLGRPGDGGGGAQVASAAKLEEMRVQRKQWQIEINNRVDLIKSFLTPRQLEKFKTVQVPDVVTPSR